MVAPMYQATLGSSDPPPAWAASGSVNGSRKPWRAPARFGELEDEAHVAVLKFTEGPLGSPTARCLFIAPIVTPADRARSTVVHLYLEADDRKAEALKKRADDARNRRRGT